MTKLIKLHVTLVILLVSTFSVALSAASLPDFATLTDEIRPSVVNITAVQKQGERQVNMFDQLFRRRSPLPQEEEYSPPPRSQGSGFIIESDGYILTNRHVVDGAESVTVYLSDRREFEAEVIGTDEGTDVALLKINAKRLPAVTIGNSDSSKPGEWVMAIGAPFGFDHTVTSGIISAKNRQIGREQYVPFIQTDVAINPGNSGGPLINMKGKVIGINSQIWTRSGGYMGISFAIPIELAIDVANQLKQDGKVSRGFIGVTYQDVDFNQAKAFGLDKVYGALIPEVSKDGPAEKAGLQSGDIVLKINRKKISRAADLPFTIGRTHPGDKVPFEVLRDGKTIKLIVEVGERPTQDEQKQTESKSLSNRLGISVTNIDERLLESINETGVIVTRLERGPAALAGIRRGDIILSMNRQKINSIADFKKVVKNLPVGRGFPVLVIRPQLGKRFFVVTIPE